MSSPLQNAAQSRFWESLSNSQSQGGDVFHPTEFFLITSLVTVYGGGMWPNILDETCRVFTCPGDHSGLAVSSSEALSSQI